MISLSQTGLLQHLFGGCCYILCFNDAVYYDGDGKGYCLSHVPGHLLGDDN
jgi:hypothetical protein